MAHVPLTASRKGGPVLLASLITLGSAQQSERTEVLRYFVTGDEECTRNNETEDRGCSLQREISWEQCFPVTGWQVPTCVYVRGKGNAHVQSQL